MNSAVFIAALGFSLAVGFGQSVPDPAEQLLQYRKDLAEKHNSSLAHFRIAEILSQQGDYQSAANEFREALSGDLQPRWIEAWAHVDLGGIYDITGQRDRAANEYWRAVKTRDNTQGALTEANQRLQSDDTGPAAQSRTAPQDLLSRTDPEYSAEARLAELEGTVVVTGVVDESEYPRDLRVTQSLGLGLDEKAIEAVQQWRFRPDTKSTNVAVDFSLPSKQSRWHLIGVDFRPPEGASRPNVLSPFYPSGAGVFTGAAIEQGRLLGAIGRQAFIALSFDVDENGVPAHIQVARSSDIVWNDQAMAVLRAWRFTPGMKDGRPVSVPCTFDFAWGPRNLGSREAAQLRSVLHAPPAPSTFTSHPEVIYSPDPPYPQQARDTGVEGTVTAILAVGEDGAPRDVRVMEGLGSVVDGSVTDALRQWRFRPPLINGQPATASVIIEVSFQLPDRVSSRILDPPRATRPAQQ
ncbi:MAG: TonB family protein [Acidobacteriia bacterium]|nr:TonB family protein [Terriglobia bacterium]